MKKILSTVCIAFLFLLVVTPYSSNAQALIPPGYTQEQKRELILSLIRVLQAQLDLLVQEQNSNSNLTVLTPNGGERWVIKNRHTISWTPDSESKDVIAYLERKEKDGRFVEVGSVIADARGSIYWTGEINAYGNYAQEGEYYVRLYNTRTGETDRSDNSFFLISPEKENILSFTVNGQTTSQEKPLEIDLAGETIDVAWSTKNAKDCFLSYGIDHRPIDISVATSGSQQLFFKNDSVGIPNYLTLRCSYTNATGTLHQLAYIASDEKARDEVSIDFPKITEIKNLKAGRESDLFSFSIDEGGHDANLNYIRYNFSMFPWDYFDELSVEYNGKKVATYNENTYPSVVTTAEYGYDLAVFLLAENTLDIASDKKIVLKGKVSQNVSNPTRSSYVSVPFIGVQGDIETGQGYALPKDAWSPAQYFKFSN